MKEFDTKSIYADVILKTYERYFRFLGVLGALAVMPSYFRRRGETQNGRTARQSVLSEISTSISPACS
jgi:hypothetical protein